jgi:hypothetical protein
VSPNKSRLEFPIKGQHSQVMKCILLSYEIVVEDPIQGWLNVRALGPRPGAGCTPIKSKNELV